MKKIAIAIVVLIFLVAAAIGVIASGIIPGVTLESIPYLGDLTQSVPYLGEIQKEKRRDKVYKYTDKNGVVHYTNTNPDSKEFNEVEMKKKEKKE